MTHEWCRGHGTGLRWRRFGVGWARLEGARGARLVSLWRGTGGGGRELLAAQGEFDQRRTVLIFAVLLKVKAGGADAGGVRLDQQHYVFGLRQKAGEQFEIFRGEAGGIASLAAEKTDRHEFGAG